MIEYRISRATATLELPNDDFKRFPCWEIIRVSDGCAWPVAKYVTRVAAENVAAFLRDQNRQGLEVE